MRVAIHAKEFRLRRAMPFPEARAQHIGFAENIARNVILLSAAISPNSEQPFFRARLCDDCDLPGMSTREIYFRFDTEFSRRIPTACSIKRNRNNLLMTF
jgi:hypothetical protein